MPLRRSSYHCQTNAGSRAKPSGVARSSKRLFCQKPPCLFNVPRNVGMRLSADTPAPVSTAMLCAARTASRAASTLDGIDRQSRKRSLLVAALHIKAGLIHGPDHLIELHLMATCFLHRHA